MIRDLRQRRKLRVEGEIYRPKAQATGRGRNIQAKGASYGLRRKLLLKHQGVGVGA